jgi:hypothetical protein
MSRLIYRGDTIDTFGKFLPTPIIETIKLASIESGDSILTPLNELLSTKPDMSTVSAVDVTKLTIRTSALFNSNDTFDSKELFDEIFDYTTSDSLYLNLFFIKDPETILSLKENKLSLDDIRSQVPAAAIGNVPYSAEIEEASQLNYIESLAGGNNAQIYSIPLSDFITAENLTTTYDDDGNPVIKAAYADFIFHVINMSFYENMTLFATMTSESFVNLAVLNLSKPAFAINFGDISFEDIKINGKIAKFGDPVFVDTNGLPYPNPVLQSLDGKFYKTESITNELVVGEALEVLKNYKNIDNKGLKNQLENVEYVLGKYGQTKELIPNLNKVNSLSPSKSGATDIGRMYSNLSSMISKMNGTILLEEQVVKRIYRNYKLVDVRAMPDLEFGSSYVSLDGYIGNPITAYPYNSWFIPNVILHDVMAKYVPETNTMDWPGKTELPYNSEELAEALNQELESIMDDIKQTIAGVRVRTEDVFDDTSGYFRQIEDDLQNWLTTQQFLWSGNGGTMYVANRGSLEPKRGEKNKGFKIADGGRRYTDSFKEKTGLGWNNLRYKDDIKSEALNAIFYWIGGYRGPMYNLIFLNVDPGALSATDDMDTDGTYDTAVAIQNSEYDEQMKMNPPVGAYGIHFGSNNLTWYEARTGHDDNWSMDTVRNGGHCVVVPNPHLGLNWSAELVMGKFRQRVASSFTWADNMFDATLTEHAGVSGAGLGAYNAGTAVTQGVSSGATSGMDTSTGGSDTRGHGDYIDDTLAYILNRATYIVWNTIQHKIESALRDIRSNQNTLQSLHNSSTITQVANNIWNSFSTQAEQSIAGNIGNAFDAYIRTPVLFYSDDGRLLDRETKSATWSDTHQGNHRVRYQKYPDLSNIRNQTDYYYRIPFGSAMTSTMKQQLRDRKPEIVQKIKDALNIIYAMEGFEMDTGIHDALADIDIVARKHGYFFFDLERYVRTHSVLSRYLDVNKFVATYPGAHDMINNAINIKNVYYWSDTHSTSFELDKQSSLSFNYTPANPSSLKFLTTLRPNGLPEVYKKAPILSSVNSFKEFFNVPGDTESAFDETTLDNYSTSWSQMVQRNYHFTEWNNGELAEGLTWLDNYRLAMFEYQYFVDDDIASKPTTTVEGGTVEPSGDQFSRDIGMIRVTVVDRSQQTLRGLMNVFQEHYSLFRTEYYEPALEQCAFNEYTQKFNDFFISGILKKYPQGEPWFNAVSLYTTYVEMFSSYFNDRGYADKLEYAEKLLDSIRPETGTIEQLMQFNEMLNDFQVQLVAHVNDSIEEFDMVEYKTFELQFDREVPILDHIGDYSLFDSHMDDQI